MNIYEQATNIGDIVYGAVSVAQSKKEFILKQLVNSFLLFIILLVFGCLDFATLTFHLEYIATISYWATVGSKVIAGICAFNIGINIIWDAEIKKDKILADNIVEYNKLIKYKQVDFEYYVNHIFNPAEKKKAYISQINKKIYLLNKFSKARDRLLYSSELPENQEKKLHNLYCIKRKELEDLKDETFIAKNIDSLKVRYLEVDPTIFELEIDGTQTTHGVKTKGNTTAGRVKATSSMVLGMVMFSMFITAFSLSLSKEKFEDQMTAFLHYLLKCCEDVGIILWQVTRGLLKARKIISSELTEPYAGRNKVLRSYIEWRLTTHRPDTESYKELNKAQEVEIEVTEEQLKQLQQQ